MPARFRSIALPLLLGFATSAVPGEAQVIRRTVDSLEMSGRVSFRFLARSDRLVEVVARTLDGSVEVRSAAIAPDSAENWTSELLSGLAGGFLPGASDQLELQRTLLAVRSDTARNAVVLFLSDTGFTQIGVTVTPDEIRQFAALLNAVSSVARHLPAREFAARAPLRTSGVVPVAATQKVPYPEALRRMRMAGTVTARFVVDSTGRVRRGTFKVVSTTHPEFSEAVLFRSPGFRFIPAMVDRIPVARTVVQTFVFNVMP